MHCSQSEKSCPFCKSVLLAWGWISPWSYCMHSCLYVQIVKTWICDVFLCPVSNCAITHYTENLRRDKISQCTVIRGDESLSKQWEVMQISYSRQRLCLLIITWLISSKLNQMCQCCSEIPFCFATETNRYICQDFSGFIIFEQPARSHARQIVFYFCLSKTITKPQQSVNGIITRVWLYALTLSTFNKLI